MSIEKKKRLCNTSSSHPCCLIATTEVLNFVKDTQETGPVWANRQACTDHLIGEKAAVGDLEGKA